MKKALPLLLLLLLLPACGGKQTSPPLASPIPAAGAAALDAAGTVEAIDALGEVTVFDGEKIAAVRARYDSLPAGEQARVVNYDLLVRAEEDLAALQAEALSGAEEAIGSLGKISIDSREPIEAARETVEALPPDLRPRVENLQTLEQAEQAWQDLSDGETAKQAEDLMAEYRFQEAGILIRRALETGAHREAPELRRMAAECRYGEAVIDYYSGHVEQARIALELCKQEPAYEEVRQDAEAFQTRVEDWLLSILPESGDVLSRSDGNGGFGVLTVHSDSRAVLVKAERVEDPAQYVLFFVGRGSQGTVRLGDGRWRIKYAAGDTWYGAEELFGTGTTFQRTAQEFTYQTKVTGDRVRYTEVTLTLTPEEGDSDQAVPMDREDF